jgi:hypothetical protein
MLLVSAEALWLWVCRGRQLDWFTPSHLNPPKSPPAAVVVVLSKDFIRKKYPMEELHLLVERRSRNVRLLPVFYDISFDDLSNKIKQYENTFSRDKQQWARDLSKLKVITGNRPDQVHACLIHFAPNERVGLSPNRHATVC